MCPLMGRALAMGCVLTEEPALDSVAYCMNRQRLKEYQWGWRRAGPINLTG